MQTAHQLPGFSADYSLQTSANRWEATLRADAKEVKYNVQPQGCCVSAPIIGCIVSSPLCP
jgi:hypothetical protein